MIASVIPALRLPRCLSRFDYTVPDELSQNIRVGQLVTIPFRSGERFGIVQSLRNKRMQKLKNVRSIVFAEPLWHETYLGFIEHVSACHGISEASLVSICLPPLQKRKLPRVTLTAIKKNLPKKAGIPIYHLYHSANERINMVNAVKTGVTLVIVPEVHDIEPLQESLSSFHTVLVWHSGLSPKERFDQWFHIRNNSEASVIIGTRSALFLPFQSLDTIIIDKEHDENHKQWDQNPRFHTKDIGGFLSQTFGAQLHLASFSPSIESYLNVFTGVYKTEKKPKTKKDLWLKNMPEKTPTIVNMRDERRGKNYSLLSETAKDAILHTVNDVVILLHRRGFATSVGCNDCGFLARCEICNSPLVYHESDRSLQCHYCKKKYAFLVSCPNCHAPVVVLRGAGTELAEKDIRHLLGPHKKHDIYRIESDTRVPKIATGSRIIIGTSSALPYVRWDKTDTLVCIDMDKQITLPEYLAVEHAWHEIQTLQFLRHDKSELFLQTTHPEHHLFRSLGEPDRFYRTELSGRQILSYPPYAYLVRYLCHASNALLAKQYAETVNRLLTTEIKTATIAHPLEMQPGYYRGQFWYTIVAKLDRNSWQEELARLNRTLPEYCLVDPNPLSLLSL